jgi:hypothetical protein
MNSGSLFLTPNTETTYGTMFLDLRETGPFVIEPPKESLCVVDDWFRYVTDMRIAGPDRGAGGKYLFLPPGFDGEVPDGYFVCRPPTFTNSSPGERAVAGRAAAAAARHHVASGRARTPGWCRSTSLMRIASSAVTSSLASA